MSLHKEKTNNAPYNKNSEKTIDVRKKGRQKNVNHLTKPR